MPGYLLSISVQIQESIRSYSVGPRHLYKDPPAKPVKSSTQDFLTEVLKLWLPTLSNYPNEYDISCTHIHMITWMSYQYIIPFHNMQTCIKITLILHSSDLSFQLLVLFIILFESFVILLQVVFIRFWSICVLRHSILLFIVTIIFLFVVVMVFEDPLDEGFLVWSMLLTGCWVLFRS